MQRYMTQDLNLPEKGIDVFQLQHNPAKNRFTQRRKERQEIIESNKTRSKSEVPFWLITMLLSQKVFLGDLCAFA
jgi:hypothetical protein